MQKQERDYKNNSNMLDLKGLSELKSNKSRTLRSMKKKPIFNSKKLFHFFHNQTMIGHLMFRASTSDSFFMRWKGKLLSFIHYNPYFRRFLVALILLDLVVFSIDSYPVDKNYQFSLETIDFVIFLVYSLECIIKIVCYGISIYFKNPFNCINIILILLNCFQYIYQAKLVKDFYSYEAFILVSTKSAPFIKTSKAFRLFEAMYYSKKFSSFAILFKAFLNSLAKLKYFILNTIILILMLALIGKELFAYKVRIDASSSIWKLASDL